MTQKVTKADKEYAALKHNVREICRLRQGKEFVWYILDLCDLFSDVFTGNSTTFYLEGKRRVGLDILALLNDADPAIYPKMLLEKVKREQGTT